MAVDPFMMDNLAGDPSYSAGEVRLALSAFVSGGGDPLGVLSGVRHSGSGTDLKVIAQSTPDMTVTVQPGIAVIGGARSATQGMYLYVLDAPRVIGIDASDPAQTRVDRVCIRIRDGNVDATGVRDGDIVVIKGTPGGAVPAVPTDATYMELGRITVPANATSIGGPGQGTIADIRRWASSLYGVRYTPLASNIPAANTVPPGTLHYAGDGVGPARWQYSDGTSWYYLNGIGTYPAWAGPDAATATTTSTSYTDTLTGTSALSVAFTVPASGRVEITVASDLSNTGGQAAYVSYRFSGAYTAAASDDWALGSWGTNAMRASMTYLHTGLTGFAGQVVTVTLQHKAVGGGTASFGRRRIHVNPVR